MMRGAEVSSLDSTGHHSSMNEQAYNALQLQPTHESLVRSTASMYIASDYTQFKYRLLHFEYLQLTVDEQPKTQCLRWLYGSKVAQ